MDALYEIISPKERAPFKAFIHSVNQFQMHWHNEIEILLVLKGTVNVRVDGNIYLLKENDLILINGQEIHSTSKTMEDNILLTLQVNLEDNAFYPEFNKMLFECKSFHYGNDQQERFDVIRGYLAKILWETSKKRQGYQLIVGSTIHLLANHLINNFDYSLLEDERVMVFHKNFERLHNMINYIDKNLERGVTLKEIADNENLSIYHTSRFIKENLGISFQDYINHKRLDKAMDLLVKTNKSITDIAYESGFSSTKSLNNLFKAIHHFTPTQYRKNYPKLSDQNYDGEKEKIKSKTYLDVDRTTVFAELFTYLDRNELERDDLTPKIKTSIEVDVNQRGMHHNFYWKKLTTFGRAAEGLREGWQKQLKELQDEIGFEYVRFHGIFSDEMMICNIGEDGHMIYNWSYVDQLFDFLKKVNIKPFVELGFMPSEIKKSDETMFWWKANISQPKDIQLWVDLVQAFIKHCINRYGRKEVESWYFEVWNEPELEYAFWIGEKEEFFHFYRETSLAIKEISPKLKVGGPSITHQALKDGTWLEDFLVYCEENKVPLDFLSLHIYPETFASEEETQGLMMKLLEEGDYSKVISLWGQTKKIYFDQNHTEDTLEDIQNKTSRNLSYHPEIHITEWSASSYGRNLINDTCYVATFVIRNILKSIGKVDSIGYWTFTDIMEEFKAGISHFHGGFGLMNKDGLKKPSYYAYYFLSKLGGEIIGQGEEYIITKDGENIQIMTYNFANFDELFLKGDTSALTHIERYFVYEDKADHKIEITLSNLFGYYKITNYQLSREYGSVFDEWVKMGHPENMTQEEIDYLRGKAQPNRNVKYRELCGKYCQKIYTPLHGINFILLEKQI